MSYATAGASTAPKSNSISNAVADFDPCIERAARYASDLQVICDRINGPRPTEVGGKIQGDSHPSPLIGSIHERRSRLVAILDDIERCLQTLDSAI